MLPTPDDEIKWVKFS